MFSRDVGIRWLEHRFVPRIPTAAIAVIIITLAGLLFAAWARLYLGRNWSSAPMMRGNHRLIRSGPYRFVRHPIYAGILLSMVSTFLANGKVRGALAVRLACFAWTIKSRMEEEFMLRNFDAESEDYRRSTGALFPQQLGNAP